MPTTPNMNLLLPVVTSTIGPLWASELNAAQFTIDSHDHTSGKGVPIPSNGIQLNADLTFNSFNATFLRSSQYTDNSSPLALPGDIRAIYASGGDLYYNNGIGQQIQITAGAGLNATSIGGIGGDYGTSTASVFYTSATSTFTFWQDVNTPALLDVGPITIRPATVSPFGITLEAPNSLAGDYTATLPGAPPASTKILTMDNTGNIAANYDVDNVTLQVSGNLLSVVSTFRQQTIVPVFTSTNFTVPSGVTSITVTGVGGGGGGGGGSGGNNANGLGAGGGGGGSCGTMRTIELAVSPGDSIQVVIGAGGTAGVGGAAGSGGTAGGSGGFSSIFNLTNPAGFILFPGGGGGSAGQVASPANTPGAGGQSGSNIFLGQSAGGSGGVRPGTPPVAGFPGFGAGAGGGQGGFSDPSHTNSNAGGTDSGLAVGGAGATSGVGFGAGGGGGGGGCNIFGIGGAGGAGDNSAGASAGANGGLCAGGGGGGGGGGGLGPQTGANGGAGGAGFVEIFYFPG